MNRPNPDDRLSTRSVAEAVPVTVVAVAVVTGYLAAEGIQFADVFGHGGYDLLDPSIYLFDDLFHSDWGHFAGNMRLWIPFGVALTWLTSDRHVLGVAVATGVMTSLVSTAIGQLGVGLSTVALGVAAATLVRSAGLAMQGLSEEALGSTVAMVFAPLALGLLLVGIVAGGDADVAHFSHFFGFLFGGAVEAMFVFADHESDR